MPDSWYAAHVVMYFRVRGAQEPGEYPVWENIVLFKAASFEHARSKAETFGRAEAVADESSTWNEVPVEACFGGVRKVLRCSVPVTSKQDECFEIEDGTEASFTQFVVHGRGALDALIRGDAVDLRYEE